MSEKEETSDYIRENSNSEPKKYSSMNQGENIRERDDPQYDEVAC